MHSFFLENHYRIWFTVTFEFCKKKKTLIFDSLRAAFYSARYNKIVWVLVFECIRNVIDLKWKSAPLVNQFIVYLWFSLSTHKSWVFVEKQWLFVCMRTHRKPMKNAYYLSVWIWIFMAKETICFGNESQLRANSIPFDLSQEKQNYGCVRHKLRRRKNVWTHI